MGAFYAWLQPCVVKSHKTHLVRYQAHFIVLRAIMDEAELQAMRQARMAELQAAGAGATGGQK
jgi:hypothetical protein